MFSLTVTSCADQVLLTPHGELDLSTAPEIDDAIEVANTAGCSKVVVDLSAVAFIDACGISALVRAQRSLARAGAVLVLRDPSVAVGRLAELVGLAAFMTIETTEPARRR